MRASFAAARFLVANARAPRWDGRRDVRTATHVQAGAERLRAWLYLPERPRSTVLALHGLTLRGIDDPRMDTVCRALAAAGCRVLAPELPDTARLRIGTADVDRIAALLAAASGPVGVFAASFSAALALRAVARGETLVTAVCAVGTCGNVGATVRHLLDAAGVDPYGRVLLFRNFGPAALRWSAPVCAALDAWLADDSLKRSDRAFPTARAALRHAEGALVDDLVSGGWHARALAPLVMAHAAPVLRALDLCPVAARIHAQVTLLHGIEDTVIPFTESVALAGRLPNAHLCVTPLLTHGDTRLTPRALPQLARLHTALAAWFRALEAPIGPGWEADTRTSLGRRQLFAWGA
jgi:pimeloyl-ACP methyl ester carboxylesterase